MIKVFKLMDKFQPCPSCNISLDLVSESVDGTSNVTEFTMAICEHCGALLRYDREGKLNQATSEDIQTVKAEAPDLYRQILVHAIKVRQQIITKTDDSTSQQQSPSYTADDIPGG